MQAQPMRNVAGGGRQAGESLAAILRGATASGQNPQDQTRQLAAGAGAGSPARTGGAAAGPARTAAAAPLPAPEGPTMSDSIQGAAQQLGYMPPYLAQMLAARHNG